MPCWRANGWLRLRWRKIRSPVRTANLSDRDTAAALARWNDLRAKDMPQLNAMLAGQRLAPLTVAKDSLAGPDCESFRSGYRCRASAVERSAGQGYAAVECHAGGPTVGSAYGGERFARRSGLRIFQIGIPLPR